MIADSLYSVLSALQTAAVLDPELKGELLAVLAAFCWAAGGPIYRKGLDTTDPWSGNLMRLALASLGFLALMVTQGTLSESLARVSTSIAVWLILSAFTALVLGDCLLLRSLKDIGVARTIPISSTYPLFVVAWSALFYGKETSLLMVLGTVFIVVAIKLISEPKQKLSVDASLYTKGAVIALSAAICWSISIVMLDYLTKVLPSEAVAGFRFIVSSVILSAIVSRSGFFWDKNSLMWIGIAGGLVLIVSNYAFVEAIRMVGSATVAPITSVYPVISVFVAAIFLREKLTPKVLAGTFLSFSGVMLVILG
ncbi:MAG: DMT family transporter [Theionarchaea archaeon]|nr:DMT family transporter [Theionarchaea archaeon]MBU6999390.1 DMT family transporter [Theionarchaea archaeon]MBU7021343.1 DMT family transporter [Theionarchaea archaeon]MBU7035921.1 DMT family transporter [Theionarchaea archaeon]MBU7041571.1 DMT family transporter [Theionarchaea archaeon]